MSDLKTRTIEALAAQNLTIATAESCTGGLLGGALTDVAGSSRAVSGGVIAYSNAVKVNMLGVDTTLLKEFGAVSEPVAAAMAAGVAETLDTDIGISTTGIAGPGGSDYKPEGRVAFGLYVKGQVATETVDFGALGRENVRRAAVDYALGMVLGAIKKKIP